MNKKILALSLSTVLALSSTTAFAADTTCTNSTKYNFSNLMKNCAIKYNCENVKYTVTVNGKTVNLNSVNWNVLLNNKTVNTTNKKVAAPVAAKPAVNNLVAQAPAVTKAPVATQSPVAKAPVKTQAPTTNTNTAVSSYEQKVVELVNVERQKAGLSSLKLDASISNIARMKSKDMATNNYFAHQSPTYGSAGDMLTKNGIKWSAWGENIASGQRTPEAVVTAWMNSEGHRANIMSSNFSKIGVGYVTNSNGTAYWTQMFTN